VRRGDTDWVITARFNWTKKSKLLHFIPGEWKLPLKNYHIYDLLQQKYIGQHVYKNIGTLRPSDVSLKLLAPAKAHPQLLATSGHILGPAGDVKEVAWKKQRLVITLKPGRHDKAQLLVNVPLLYSLKKVKNGGIIRRNHQVVYIQPRSENCTLIFTKLTSLGKNTN
jgi:hypothetical protein